VAPNASNAQPKTIIFGPSGSPIAVDAQGLPFQPDSPLRQAYDTNATRQNPVMSHAPSSDSAAIQPPILALAVKAGKDNPVKPPVKNALPQPKPAPVWMVQVAAFAQRKDAEALATNLRFLGYDAFTQEAEVNAKLWHRVRVGKTLNSREALELKKALQANNKFEQAFITH
jgi:cell division septation protein DedD